MQPRKYFILLGLSFLLILSVNSPTKAETEKITITDAKQLKGIWEALYLYQEIPRQERINTFRPPLPENKEFESRNDYQERVNGIKEVYERRVEESFKREINNERRFKNALVALKFTYTPQVVTTQKPFSHIEETKVSRQTVGITDIKMPAAWIQESQYGMSIFETRVIHDAMTLPIPPTVPPFAEWRIEEDNLLIQEDIAYFNFSLDQYDMENKKFLVIFPPSQFPQGEKDWVYYIRKLNYGDSYMKMFGNSDVEKMEQWLIKFDKVPTYLNLPLDKAKTVRKNEDDIFLELEFQPISAEKKIDSDTTFYILEVKLISATLKNMRGKIYVVADNS